MKVVKAKAKGKMALARWFRLSLLQCLPPIFLHFRAHLSKVFWEVKSSSKRFLRPIRLRHFKATVINIIKKCRSQRLPASSKIAMFSTGRAQTARLTSRCILPNRQTNNCNLSLLFFSSTCTWKFMFMFVL